jgi:hypothetical protein
MTMGTVAPVRFSKAEIRVVAGRTQRFPTGIGREAHAPSWPLVGGRTGTSLRARAPLESFFHTHNVELVHQHRWATRHEA